MQFLSLNTEIMFAIISRSPKIITPAVKYKNLNDYPPSTLYVTGKGICWINVSTV